MTIRHVVFDIGKVLLHWDLEIPFKRLIPDDSERTWFLENICTGEWNLEQDRGRPWAEGEALLVEKHPAHETNIRAFRKHWQEMVPHPISGSVKILHEMIDAGHDVTMLTNFAPDTFAEVRERFGFLNRPRGVTVSGEVRMLKPEPEIYIHHSMRFDLVPEDCLFIDDSAKNVDGAKACGWQAIRFTDPDTLRRDLVAQEIL